MAAKMPRRRADARLDCGGEDASADYQAHAAPKKIGETSPRLR